ncbi:MAG: restriction endonuclease [Halobacteria archaeon]|nr:restriction endonuclease [Halobacteria archaeon]
MRATDSELREEIEGMSWSEFKGFVIGFFEDAGYKIINVQRGVLDEAFYLTALPPGKSEKELVQIKYNTEGNTVNGKEVQDSIDFQDLHDHLSGIVIVTNTNFSEKARELSKVLDVTLLERDEISILVTPS